MADRTGEVPTDHRWQDAGYVAEWAANANEAAHRGAMFDAAAAELRELAAVASRSCAPTARISPSVAPRRATRMF